MKRLIFACILIIMVVGIVSAAPPKIVMKVDPTTGDAPLTITFSEDSGDTTITTWLWNFGNGDSLDKPSGEYTYDKVGEYELILSVWNDKEEVSTEKVTITVTDPTPMETPTPTPTATATPSAESIKTKETTETKTVINGTTTTFSDIDNKYAISSTVYINDTKFIPTTADTSKTMPEWSTENSVVVFSYELKEATVKETIVLKEPKDLKFDITVNKGNVLIPWFNGEYKIVEETLTDTMTGIVIAKPYGTDANGRYIEMNYIQNGNVLELKYNPKVSVRNPDYVMPKDKKDIDLEKAVVLVDIAYPLTIDPTWTYVTNRYESDVGSDKVLMFNTTGTKYWVVPEGVTSIWYLVIAGGAGGGGNPTYADFTWGGGGGAGGVLNGSKAVSAGDNITVVVGTNGALFANGVNSSIYNSSFGTVASKGGGHGGYYYDASGTAGGSGGGEDGAAGGTYGAGVSGQGYNGGTGQNGASASGGGGGGATSVGANGVAGGNGAAGGSGFTTSITGESQCLAGGGGGGVENTGSYTGGTATCGGGHGEDTQSSATAATGGGGGGGHTSSGAGGSGIIFIRYTPPAAGGDPPVASFTKSATVIRIPGTLTLTDTSTNTPTSWAWSWGDGTANSTGTATPTHKYTKRGMYTINLAATNADGTGVATAQTVRVVGYENTW